ncbi:MAG: glycosyltransferase [Pseudomonadales bacterium]|nr:glycosyltransferase [Pseudomonadales bacterium]
MIAPDISIVIPVFNEEAGLPLLFARLYPALDALQRSYEVIFVDDGSSDRSVELLRATVAQHPATARAVILAHNVGQHLAILAAFERTRGRHIITLDADLQNPPEEIGAVVAALEQGADYVGTIRQVREDVWWRRVASRWLNRLRERTTKISITDQGCMLRGYDRRIVEAVNHCGEVTPFVPALAYTFARRPVEIPVKHEERAAGVSKYSMFQLVRLNFDLMTGYSLIPLQAFSVSGIVIAFLSLAFVVYLAIRRLVVGPEAAGLFTLFGIAFFLLGCVLFGLGIVGEYVGRIFEQVRSRPRYVVAEFLGDQRVAPRPESNANVAASQTRAAP